MTRRSFISDLLKCGIATTFLPGAGRIWKPTYEQSGIRFVIPQPMRIDWDLLNRQGVFWNALMRGDLTFDEYEKILQS